MSSGQRPEQVRKKERIPSVSCITHSSCLIHRLLIICPVCCSERNTNYYHWGSRPIPFVQFTFEPDWLAPVISETIVIRHLEFQMRPMNVVADLNFIIKLVKAMVTRRVFMTASMVNELVMSVKRAQEQLTSTVTQLVPLVSDEHLFSMMFIKAMQIHSITFQLLLSLQIEKVRIPLSLID